MRRLRVAAIAVLFFPVHPALLRATPADTTRLAVSYRKGVSLSGRVSSDGKEFVTGDDNRWVVTNAESLKGLENLTVTVKCRIDPNKRALWIVMVEETSSRKSQANDAAFRR